MQARHKGNIFEKNSGLWGFLGIICAFIIAILTRSYFSGSSIVNDAKSEKGIAVANNNGSINQNNINQKSPLELENEKHRSDNKAKISGFFRYWNAQEYLKGINNIDLKIQKPFTIEHMKEFRNNMNDFFEIISNEERGEINNSDYYIYTKHTIKLSYRYQKEYYIDTLLVVVGRKKDDLRQHHITQIRCDGTSGPFCDFLKG